MIQNNLFDLFGPEDTAPVAEGPITVMRQLTASPCSSCRLGMENPRNPGFLWKGNPDAHIAIVGDMPSLADMSARRAFADAAGNELNGWIETAGIPGKDVFFTNLVQCKTPPMKAKLKVKEGTQRLPHAEAEVGICFPARLSKLLKSMPNLEVIWCLGLTTMAKILGGEPRIRAYQGFWFGTDLFPGKVAFGMPHPRDFDSTTSTQKRGRLNQCLLYFHNEYYGKKNAHGRDLCPARHIMNVLKFRERQRHDARTSLSIL